MSTVAIGVGKYKSYIYIQDSRVPHLPSGIGNGYNIFGGESRG